MLAEAKSLDVRKQNHYMREQLISCGRGELFGDGNAQLPLPSLLMFDRISHIADNGGAFGKGEVVAELDIRPDMWFFDCATLKTTPSCQVALG